jgi:hypothetical protein
MGSNEEQIQLLVSAHVDHVSYALVLYSLAFVVYFCTPHIFFSILILVILFQIWLYSVSGRNSQSGMPKYDHPVGSGHTRLTSMEQRRVRDVEEFELGGLLEDEDADKRDSGSVENAHLAKRSSIEHE